MCIKKTGSRTSWNRIGTGHSDRVFRKVDKWIISLYYVSTSKPLGFLLNGYYSSFGSLLLSVMFLLKYVIKFVLFEYIYSFSGFYLAVSPLVSPLVPNLEPWL